MHNEIFFAIDPMADASRRYLPTIEEVRHLYGGRYAIRFLGIFSEAEGSEAVAKAVCLVRELQGDEAAWRYLKTIAEAYEAQAVDIAKARLLFGFYGRLFGESARFAFLYNSERAEALLRQDMQRARAMGIAQAPATAIVDADGHLIALKGATALVTLQKYLDTKQG